MIGILILETILQLQNQHIKNIQSADDAVELATVLFFHAGHFGSAREVKAWLRNHDFSELGYDKVPAFQVPILMVYHINFA